ncbi:MAG TPA: hypothetical protein V6D05_17365 [Stenomitos sp.]
MDLTDKEAVERAAEFTFMEQGIPGLGEMPILESYKLGFVAGMRLAGEEILRMAREKSWHPTAVEALDRDLDAQKVQAIAQAIALLQAAGLEDVKLLSRGGELRIGWS